MLRLLFWIGLLVVIWLVVRQRWQRLRRRMRGEPDPEPQGLRTVTLVVIAIAIVYGVLIGYRLVVDGVDGLY